MPVNRNKTGVFFSRKRITPQKIIAGIYYALLVL